MSKEKPPVVGIELDELINLIQIAVRNEIETCIADGRFGTEWKDEILNRNKTAGLFEKSPEKISSMYDNKEIPGFKTGREYFFLKSQLVKLFKYKK